MIISASARRRALACGGALVAAAALTAPAHADAERCAALAEPGRLPDTLVDSADYVSADAETGAPPHCAVTGTVSLVEGSEVGVVYRFPDAWNGGLLGLGGNGWMGNTRLSTALEGLSRGYATLQTDGGHAAVSPLDASWMIDEAGAPDMTAIEDWGHRAVHAMTAVGKAAAAAYYGRAHERAYWHGCSTGGRQGLMEVQRYPGDYDGVIAGAPVLDLLTQTTGFVRSRNFTAPERRLADAHPQLLAEAVLARCDAADGVADGVIRDPRACSWDPGELACAADEAGDHCLTPSQVDAVRVAYDGVLSADGATAAYPISRGTEDGWARFASPNATPGAGGALNAALFGDADFDHAAFDPDTDVAVARSSAMAAVYEADDAAIDAFLQGGGKLILWHGFSDPGPSPIGTLGYYRAVLAETAPESAAANGVRLFLAPGVGHCRGGPGPDRFDLLSALESWVENGVAPDEMTATKADSDLSWPVCAYPKLPTGDARAGGEGVAYVCE